MQSEEQMKPSRRVTEGRDRGCEEQEGREEGGTLAPAWEAVVAGPCLPLPGRSCLFP